MGPPLRLATHNSHNSQLKTSELETQNCFRSTLVPVHPGPILPMADIVAPDRTLPHNLEAERSVLGAILLHNHAFNLAAEVIDAHDFYRDAHRRIFDKMVKLSERGDAIDLVTLKEELGRAGDLDEVGGPAYIAALVDGVPRSTNVEHYARIVKEKSNLRNLILSVSTIVVSA